MSRIRNRDVPLKSLVLPGTHDSGSWNVSFSDPKLNEEPFGSFRSVPLAGNIVRGFCVTQNRTLYQQCVDGMRLFDFRIALAKDNQWYLWHGFRNITAREGLAQLAKFTVENPTEVLVIFFRIDGPSLSDAQKRSIDAMLEPYTGYMLDHSKMSVDAKLSSILAAKKNWVLFANKYLSNTNNLYGDYGLLQGRWFNEWDVGRMVSNLDGELNAAPEKSATNGYYVMQWIVTPDTNDVVKSALSTYLLFGVWPKTLRDHAKSMNKELLKFFQQDDRFDQAEKKACGIWGDFFQESAIMELVARWNDVTN
jgi:hypothetical protein